ncbi:hypothetical protein HUG10_19145 (plasmid) [Halorarum halophilum]|uniref:Dolichyl-phosphate-mannose-protein mannosyltransferase n=1 Tax=Halorarum halophilum TaxID=2743090 RepID=A0A7D5L320_9EURY|nr:hypothetical protein [Halobaculum halophilum]QLG29723.1 hypothetical protein HUG10_19145 [Halobaculum halophilum]
MRSIEDTGSRGLQNLSDRPSLSLEELPWLGVALSVGTLVGAVYLITHPYPAYGAGLFLEIAERIATNGYRLPSHVSHYTADGVPLAYPPLMFYVSALLMNGAGVDPVALTRYLPVVCTTLYLVPYYFISRELLSSKLEATVATTLLAVTPPALQWHLSAGGLVRAPAFLFSLTGIYVGIRLFRSGSARLTVPGAVLFGLTVLTHPVYTVFFGLSYLLLYAAFDRTLRGLVLGAVVAGGGVALAAPWWTQVIAMHGTDVFASAAGTHSGLLGGAQRFAAAFVYTLVSSPPIPVFFVSAYAGMFYFLGTRRLLLPTWLVTSAMVIGKERFQFVAGSMMAAVLLCAVVRGVVHRRLPAESWRWGSRVVLAAVVVSGVAIGALYGAGALSMAHAGSPGQPQFIDQSDRTAMTWVDQHTNANAEFVVLGDAAEWFPAFTDRTILVGPWGVEWTSPARYAAQLSLYQQLSTCESEQCVTTALASASLEPEYIYVPKGHYTVRGNAHDGTDRLRQSLAFSDRYRLVYENEGVAVFRVEDDPESADSRLDDGSATGGDGGSSGGERSATAV